MGIASRSQLEHGEIAAAENKRVSRRGRDVVWKCAPQGMWARPMPP